VARRVIRYCWPLAGLVLAAIIPIEPGCGSEIDTGSALLNDRDQDGMPSGWEVIHDLDPDDPSDALQDPDGDNYNNLREYLAGTDPRSAESVLRFTKISQIAPNEFFLQFQAVSNRSYSVVYRMDHQSIHWINIRDFEAAPTNRLIELTNIVPRDVSVMRFYSIVTQPIP
jgi:hypothetical protein